jgi:hypothetical protein
MAEYAPITSEMEWFVGEKKTFEFSVIGESDVTAWNVEWTLRQANKSPTVLIYKRKADGGVVTPGGNKIQVTVEPEDTLDISVGGGEYDHALKRTDSGSEGVLSYGEAVLRQAASR